MSKCCCRFALAVLVIVFAWVDVSWGPIALTVLGALLAILALCGSCCCFSKSKTSASETSEKSDSPTA